jgi:hypothetical protein
VPEMPDDAYERGVSAGEIAQRLKDHDRHFERLNGSLGDVAKELHGLTLAVQQLGLQAIARDATVVTTAAALKDAEQARRDNSERHWSPMMRLAVVIGAMATVAGAVAAVVYGLRGH